MTISVPDEIGKVLVDFEGKPVCFNYHELHHAIEMAFKPNENTSQPLRSGWWAELAAFEFRECPMGELSEWETHYGPMMSATYENGTTLQRPDIKELDQDIFDYWKKRAESSKHPVCRARYADLVWDLSQRVVHKREDVKYAFIAIDAYIDYPNIVTSETAMQGIKGLERALELAISLNDKGRIKNVKYALFKLYEKIARPGLDGTWPFLFDLLYGNSKVLITGDEEKKIVASLEEILRKSSDPDQKECFSPWGAQAAAERLAKHYRRIGMPQEVTRVIRTFGKSFEHIASDAGPLVAMSWLQNVYDSYRDHGLKDDVTRVQAQAKEKGARAKDEMKTIVSEVKISSDEMDQLLSEFTKGDLTSSLTSIPAHFIPNIEHVRSDLEQQRQEHPLQALIGVTTIDDDQIVSRVGSIDDDPEGRIRLELGNKISISTIFLSAVLERVKEHYSPTASQLLDHLYQSPLFDSDRRDIVLEGIEAYLSGDYVKSVHVMIPQIEHNLRRLMSLLGQPTNKPTRMKGVMQEQNINDVLVNPIVREQMPEDMRLYFLVSLADPKGLNLRHRVSHGLMKKGDFNQRIGDLIFNIMLCLGVLKPDKRDYDFSDNEARRAGEKPADE